MRAYPDRSDEFIASGRSIVGDRVTNVAQDDIDAIDALIQTAFDVPQVEDEAVECLASRLTAGLGVQLLWAESGTYITLTLEGETETFPVPREHALDAFYHPFAYGGTLL